MSQRTVLRPHSVISNGDMSKSTITSLPTVLNSLTKFSYEVSWTGSSPTGTLELQVSNSYALNPDGSVGSGGTWTSMPLDVNGSGSSTISISGNSGSGFIDVTVNAGYAVQLLYTRSGGSGTLNAIISGKVA